MADTVSIRVVMTAHNAVPYLADSINSLLVQTLADFEFIIREDASTDGTGLVLKDWAQRDSRIRLIQSSKLLGVSGSANYVVREVRASVCARMDADDVLHPDSAQAPVGGPALKSRRRAGWNLV